jgi:hypothetical protein
MKAYRTLVLRRDILELQPEAQQRIPALLKVWAEFRARASERAENGGRTQLPERGQLRRLAEKFVRAYNALEWLRGRVIRRGMRAPLVLDARLRLGGGRDLSRVSQSGTECRALRQGSTAQYVRGARQKWWSCRTGESGA